MVEYFIFTSGFGFPPNKAKAYMLAMEKTVGQKRHHDEVGDGSDVTNKAKRAKRLCLKPRRRVQKKTSIANKHRVRGICLACKEPVTVKQPRFKMSGIYFHISCYCKVPTPFSCRICGSSTVLGDVLMLYNNPDKKRASLTPVACDHVKCIQRCLVANKARRFTARDKIIISDHKKMQLLD